MTAHVHNLFATSHRTATIVWTAVVVVTLGLVAAVLIVMTASRSNDTAPANTGNTNLTTHTQVTNNDCGPTRIVHPC